MDIVEFKNALRSGAVHFSYKKKDGTVRDAYGTLNKALLPPEKAPVIKFKCKNINWDTEGHGPCGLPDKMIVEFDEAWFNAATKTCTNSNFEDLITEELTDVTGFYVFDYEYERVEKRAPKKLAEGTILYYDIDKAGYRSFNESQLIDWKEFVK